jgi:hypothetical protein
VNLPGTCPTCGQPRGTRYCGACGERAVTPDDLSLKRFFRSLGEELVPAFGGEDEEQGLKRAGGRVYRTVYTLFRFPGRLTSDYVLGRRRPYMKPVQVYLTISVIFFILGTIYFRYSLGDFEYVIGIGETHELIAQEAARLGVTVAAYTQRFDRRLTAQKKTMIAFLIPIFAIAMIPLYRRRRYGEHLIFSIHLFAALLLFLGVILKGAIWGLFYGLGGLEKIIPAAGAVSSAIGTALDTEFFFVAMIYLVFMLYTRAALYLVYDGKPVIALLKAMVLVIIHAFLIVTVFRQGLFYTTFYSFKWFG